MEFIIANICSKDWWIFLKRCVLHADKVCNECGECDDRCELDPQKICDNCFRCLDSNTKPYAEIPISGVFFEDDFSPEGAEAFYSVNLEDGFVPDTDDSWKDGPLLEKKTLPYAYASRAKRKHH